MVGGCVRLDVRIDDLRDFACSPDGKMIAAVGSRSDSDRNVVVYQLTLTDLAIGSGGSRDRTGRLASRHHGSLTLPTGRSS